jgi:hypothetical protein
MIRNRVVLLAVLLALSCLFGAVVFAIIIRITDTQSPLPRVVEQGAFVGIAVCFAVGSPAAAASLWIRRRHSRSSAQLGGIFAGLLLVAALMVIASAYDWRITVLVPLVSVAMVVFETALALKLSRRS